VRIGKSGERPNQTKIVSLALSIIAFAVNVRLLIMPSFAVAPAQPASARFFGE
jgi:hypothetical protein